ncbi:MAG: cellulose synthase subunit BcsC-related outer membrane protein [Gammaproteobacteria bacterium]
MSWMVALAATLAIAAPPEGARDAAGWRAQSDTLYSEGDHAGALEAAKRALEFDRRDPWSRYAWARALAAIDPNAARAALPGLQDPGALSRMTADDRARLDTALGYLCLDLGIEALATMHFESVSVGTSSHPQAQAGLAILAVRRGHTRQALVYFVAARISGRLEPPLAELEREARFQVVLHEFTTARDLRDANAAGRAYATLDELRPSHPATLRARADLAYLRGDAPARERALRDLLAVDRQAPGAASELVDTLLVQDRPWDALVVARDLAPERMAVDTQLQAIERNWVSHVDAVLGGRLREGQTPHDRLELAQLRIAWAGSSARIGRFRVAAAASRAESDSVPAGEPFGNSVALPTNATSQHDNGVAALLDWMPSDRLSVELGHTPTAYQVSNITGALRFHLTAARGPWDFGLERQPVADSLLSLAGAIDPVTGRDWGGITRNRAYVSGAVDSGDLRVYGTVAHSLLDGHGVNENSQWEGEAGFWQRAASGDGWLARLGGNVRAIGYDDNRSHFTLGHGGYFSPHRFLEVGPAFDLQGQRSTARFRFEGGVAWQRVREDDSEFFPADPARQAASGDPRYAGDTREGIGARIAATVEWRLSLRAVAGLRLEGVRGEDHDQVRLQVYTRRWDRAVTEPLRAAPVAALASDADRLF